MCNLFEFNSEYNSVKAIIIFTFIIEYNYCCFLTNKDKSAIIISEKRYLIIII
ncbi:hypothetical protein CNEO3_250006 [Clostridium neonatale]|uniref:Uncharacterized protein n=1 Tax=Clostridium neonatale TaxID=137838 RepID=A0AA86JSH0_9CLOT|nr:hypothetical protein CNEO_44756 [Clostridium neonatale]CAI3561937.1 hypothetical protein CNEO4_360016 [Clostridium neonatale]CAI3596050.1 hypothetical protein CNEO3_10074 [Clostridium neonatale]CAI3602064.1 hypothetical protein CNEO3_250006 [Clostridium neonatale]CAI3609948.1 hypothetical protein CNEO3_370015 [Clostridium neonatale]